jgi:hypothetical protein
METQFTNHTELLQALNDRVRSNPSQFYTNDISKETAYWLDPDDALPVTERMERLVEQVEQALPNILSLTNQLAAVLSNSASMTANLSEVAASARPVVSNLALATANLDHPGALGEWLLPTNIHQHLEGTLEGANTNLAVLADTLARSLDNLANLTSNLNAQVHANTNILGNISDAVLHIDSLVQGLKQHWLFRSAFRSRESGRSDPEDSADPVRSPKTRGQY